MPYDKRADNVFPSAILTLVSIIQGVAFYVLMDNTSKIINNSSINFEILIRILLSLFSLIIVAFEYIWFVGLFTGTISIIDVSVVFALGVGEVAYSNYLNSSFMWWTSNGIFLIIGVIGFWNSIIKSKNINYVDEGVELILLNTLRRNRLICLICSAISITISLLVYYCRSVFACELIGFASIWLLYSYLVFMDHKFLSKIRIICS